VYNNLYIIYSVQREKLWCEFILSLLIMLKIYFFVSCGVRDKLKEQPLFLLWMSRKAT
jgi:hypothetical protein